MSKHSICHDSPIRSCISMLRPQHKLRYCVRGTHFQTWIDTHSLLRSIMSPLISLTNPSEVVITMNSYINNSSTRSLEVTHNLIWWGIKNHRVCWPYPRLYPNQILNFACWERACTFLCLGLNWKEILKS